MDTASVEQGTGRQSLVDAVEEVRERTLEIVAEIDHLRLQEIPSIKAEYAVRVGCWETRLLEAELACRRAKRKLALIQARINDGKSVELDKIEEQLNVELEEWQARVAASLATLHAQLDRLAGSTALSPEETRRMKRIYRTLARRLHPDLHPGQSEEEAHLFVVAQRAYEAGQLDVLQALEVSTRHLEPEDDLAALQEDDLMAALELAQIELEVMEGQRDALLEDPIFALRAKLADAEWLTRTVVRLQRSIAEFDKAREAYEQKIADALAREGGAS